MLQMKKDYLYLITAQRAAKSKDFALCSKYRTKQHLDFKIVYNRRNDAVSVLPFTTHTAQKAHRPLLQTEHGFPPIWPRRQVVTTGSVVGTHLQLHIGVTPTIS